MATTFFAIIFSGGSSSLKLPCLKFPLNHDFITIWDIGRLKLPRSEFIKFCWFGTCFLYHSLGMSSSQLTHFPEGSGSTTHQMFFFRSWPHPELRVPCHLRWNKALVSHSRDGKIQRPQYEPHRWRWMDSGNHPLLWPHDSGQWIMIIYPDLSEKTRPMWYLDVS